MNHNRSRGLERTAWAISSHFLAIAGNHVLKSISNSVLKLIACLAPSAPLRNLFQNNISPTARNHLISSQNVFVPIHTSLFLCQHCLLSEAIFLLPWCSSACAFGEQGCTPQPSSHLAKYARSPQMGSSVWRLSLESGSAPVPLPVHVPGAEVMRVVDVPITK